MRREVEILSARVRFILQILDEEIILKGKDEEQLDEELEEKGYPKFTKGKLEYDPNDINSNPSYDYLTSMPIKSMTRKRVEELMKQRDEKNVQYDILKTRTIYDLWNEDLDSIEQTYQKHLKDHDAELGTTESVKATTAKKATVTKKKVTKA